MVLVGVERDLTEVVERVVRDSVETVSGGQPVTLLGDAEHPPRRSEVQRSPQIAVRPLHLCVEDHRAAVVDSDDGDIGLEAVLAAERDGRNHPAVGREFTFDDNPGEGSA